MAAALALVLRNNMTLKELVLQNCAFRDRGARELFTALRHNTGLETFSVEGGLFRDECLEDLSESLRYNRTLRNIYLGWSEIGDQGIVAVVEGLQHNSSVSKVTINTNNIGDEGFKAFGVLLSITTSLEELHLTSTGANDMDATVLAIGMAKNRESSMRVLNLEDNGIEVDGAAALGMLLATTGLTELNISSNPNGDLGVQQLLAWVEENPGACSMQALDLGETKMAEAERTTI